MATKLETLSGYKIGQTVGFIDPCYGYMKGTISKIYRHYKTKEIMIKIKYVNGDSYNFFVETLNKFNNKN